METNFNFKSQPATSIEQSERLLALGLKKETADLGWVEFLDGNDYHLAIVKDYSLIDIPAWSLHRLIEMIQTVFVRVNICGPWVHIERKAYNQEYYATAHNNTYDNIIDCIEWLIKEGDFNKEFFGEKK